MSTWSGKKIGNVLIGELIARGGMAEVYYGTHTTLNRKVAVKIMRDHVEEDPDSRARFAREARVVAGLEHPNIIQISDYDLVDGRPCIVMELVSGASLGNYLKALRKRGETLPHRTTARLLTSVASAMDYAHERNIVHRDIKPANILLRSKSGSIDLDGPLPEDVEPVLTDFGLVRLLDSTTQTSTGTVSGTPAYMSPEQARGDHVDRKTDIYSLGVVLYEMLAGNVPFDAESSFGVLMKHLNEPPPPIEGISADMQAIIDRALAKEPEQRFESAAELVNEFIAVLDGKAISQKTEEISELLNTPEPQKESAVPSRTMFIIGGIVALVAVTLLGIRLFRGPKSQLDPNQPIGQVTFQDFNYIMDKALITVSGLPDLKQGTHYEGWLISQSGGRRNIGEITLQGNVGQLTFISPESTNLFATYDQFEVTLEPNDDPNPNESSREIVASSVFPPLALIPVRHLLDTIGSTPYGTALVQGLWSAADTVNTSVVELRQAYMADDEETMRLKTEEIINQLAGDKNTSLYKDWNGNGGIEDPVEGFGLLLNGEQQGYIPQTIEQAQLAADAADSTTNITQHSEEVVICAENMENQAEQLLNLALELQTMPFDSGMEAVITEMEILSAGMLYGDDADANGRIEPIAGEGGADSAYESAYSISEMPIFTGPERIPPPDKTNAP